MFTKDKVTFSEAERQKILECEAKFVALGYHSFLSVENDGLRTLLQTFADLGAKYGEFKVDDILCGRMAVQRHVKELAKEVKEKIKECCKDPIADGSIAITTDMYTDNFRKRSFLDVHCFFVDEKFSLRHKLLAVKHFGIVSHTGENIARALTAVFDEYGLSKTDTPTVTDKGSNIVKALKIQENVRLDCMNHRLHTCLRDAWELSCDKDKQLKFYEESSSSLVTFVKHSSGIQEQLPCSLKHGGDTRPWTALYRRADSIEKSYSSLEDILKTKGKLLLIANVDRALNKEILFITERFVNLVETLEKACSPTIQLVVPTYYLLANALSEESTDSESLEKFKKQLLKSLDAKYWPSINALHWIATHLDPFFRDFDFLPNRRPQDLKFKTDISSDVKQWTFSAMRDARQNLEKRNCDDQCHQDFEELSLPVTDTEPSSVSHANTNFTITFIYDFF